VHSSAGKQIADLEVKVKSVETHRANVAVAGEKRLQYFDDKLVCDLAELGALYVCNTHAIGGLCSLMFEGEPSFVDYLRLLSTEISGLPDMFGGVNENFATATVKGALTMAGDPVDLEAV
jgi:hypothetical protein